jgi:hypothetical protein
MFQPSGQVIKVNAVNSDKQILLLLTKGGGGSKSEVLEGDNHVFGN